MVISSLFLILTLAVFGLLWEKYRGNIQRWTICCYVGALLLMYIFFILSYFSPSFDSDVVTNAPLCRFIGIGMHFTFLMNFCFLTAINFEIWWTVRYGHPLNSNVHWWAHVGEQGHEIPFYSNCLQNFY